jgi:hypothetical protein
MLHSRVFPVKNYMTWFQSKVTLCLVSNPVSWSFLVLVWPTTDVVTQFLTHLFDKIFKKSKNSEKQRQSKKYVFNIFGSFLAFSTSSKKEFKFSKVFGTRSTFHASFLKSLIFLIESTLILLVFKKYKKIKKNQIYKKRKKLRDQVWKPSNIFTYKY